MSPTPWHKQAFIYMSIIEIRLGSADFSVKGLQGCITFSSCWWKWSPVGNEWFGLIWILSGAVLPSETLTGSQCLSSWQSQLEKQGMSGLEKTFLASLSHSCYLTWLQGRLLPGTFVCCVLVENEITFRRHTMRPNLCHFLRPNPNRTSLKRVTSLVTFPVLTQYPVSSILPWTVWLIPTSTVALLCWYVSSMPCWRSGPLAKLHVFGRLDLGRLLAKMYPSQELVCYRASWPLSVLSYLRLAHSENTA